MRLAVPVADEADEVELVVDLVEDEDVELALEAVLELVEVAEVEGVEVVEVEEVEGLEVVELVWIVVLDVGVRVELEVEELDLLVARYPPTPAMMTMTTTTATIAAVEMPTRALRIIGPASTHD